MRIAPLLPSSPGDERDLGAEDLEQLAAFERHVLGHDDAQLVAAQLRDEREPDAGVARRRFEDRRAGREHAVGLGQLDHLERDAVLRRTARVLALELGPDVDARASGDSWCTPTSGVLPISPRMLSCFGTRSRAARDRGEDREHVAVGELGVEAVEVADVVVVLVDVHELVQPARRRRAGCRGGPDSARRAS